ncbi:MAG: SigB/SigF/SigG family RNA polymerase sigma factor [Acidimicrobiales bacterium]|nr:SigB/SigF/SigG family RNA polymerase sigma factor [Acidimicrobiales bacterium]
MSSRPDQGEIDALFERYRQTRRRRDRNALVEAHIGFANHLARRYSNRGLERQDLEQVALLALVKAVDRFDPGVGAAFTTFAGRTIEGELKRHFRDAAWAVRVPRSMKELHLLVRSTIERLTKDLSRSPSVSEVAEALDLDVDQVVGALGAGNAFSTSSLEGGSSVEGDDLIDRSARIAEVDEQVEATPSRVLVERLLDSLPERERDIVRLRFYDELTQTEIADRVGVSQMHVSRLLRRSMALMREEAAGGDS